MVFEKFKVFTWKFVTFSFFLVFLLPTGFVLLSLFGEYNDNWQHLIDYVITDYVFNSLYLILGVSFISLILGVGSAWLVTNYEFYFKNFLEWALILPLAVPPYILAYSFTGLFDSYGTINEILRAAFNLGNDVIIFPNIRNIFGAIIVFSFTLYPYVYLTARMAFINQSKSLIEAGKILGLNDFMVFIKLGIPLIRPAIVAGLALVIMETLSDFGAVEHFAVQTFTTGIFRTWFGMYDLNTAMQLSSFLLIFVAFFLFLERYERNKLSFSYGSSSFKKTSPQKLKGISNYLAFTFCFLPIFVGFILPILEISSWAIFYTSDNFFSDKFISSFLNTIYLGFLAAIFCTFFSLGLNFLKRFDKSILLSSTSFSLSLGYAVPGLVLAIGIIQFFSFLDNEIFKSFLNITLVGSVFGLLLAYVIKSYALANSAIESGFQRIDSSIDDVSRTLKKSKLGIMFRIHMPLLKTSIFTSILLVISEVIKELPATLILRPFNFDTLAVSTYLYAAEERMYEAAAPAMMIVLIGLVPIIFLSKIIRDSRPGK